MFDQSANSANSLIDLTGIIPQDSLIPKFPEKIVDYGTGNTSSNSAASGGAVNASAQSQEPA